jgi:hypothetical protein
LADRALGEGVDARTHAASIAQARAEITRLLDSFDIAQPGQVPMQAAL